MIDFTRPGRISSGSKTGPKGHVCVFNANICVRSEGKIWFGDIDLTADKADLQRLANERNEAVYVLRERDARFENEWAPKFENAVTVIEPERKD